MIHISSHLGHVGAANRSVYCTTKHAVEGLTRRSRSTRPAWGARELDRADVHRDADDRAVPAPTRRSGQRSSARSPSAGSAGSRMSWAPSSSSRPRRGARHRHEPAGRRRLDRAVTAVRRGATSQRSYQMKEERMTIELVKAGQSARGPLLERRPRGPPRGREARFDACFYAIEPRESCEDVRSSGHRPPV